MRHLLSFSHRVSISSRTFCPHRSSLLPGTSGYRDLNDESFGLSKGRVDSCCLLVGLVEPSSTYCRSRRRRRVSGSIFGASLSHRTPDPGCHHSHKCAPLSRALHDLSRRHVEFVLLLETAPCPAAVCALLSTALGFHSEGSFIAHRDVDPTPSVSPPTRD